VTRSRGSIAVILLSVMALGFWGLGQTEVRVLRRALSAWNANDFSWRNRVAAYEGALQVMAAKPWFGFGPGQTREAFEHFFRPASIADGSAILLNDFLETGMALGLPALVWLAGYVLLRLAPPRGSAGRGSVPSLASVSDRIQSLQAVCGCGAIVLLVGFWFNRGLFCLALAAPFWVLLELAGADSARFQPTRGGDGCPAPTS
jgi:O-antigen ligase